MDIPYFITDPAVAFCTSVGIFDRAIAIKLFKIRVVYFYCPVDYSSNHFFHNFLL